MNALLETFTDFAFIHFTVAAYHKKFYLIVSSVLSSCVLLFVALIFFRKKAFLTLLLVTFAVIFNRNRSGVIAFAFIF